MSDDLINKLLGSKDIDMVLMKIDEMNNQQKRLAPVIEQGYVHQSQLLFKKFEALQQAGFKEEQAMQIILQGVKL